MDFSLERIINSAIFIAVVFVIYFILMRILRLIFRRVEQKNASTGRNTGAGQKHKLQTISQMIGSLLRYILLVLVILVVLANFGVDVSSLLAGFGIVAAVFGLACQDMLRDIFAGIAIIAEGQFTVGDTVSIGDFKGTVSNVGLRTTEITGKNGEVKIVSNRNMDGFVNYSKAEKK